MGEQKNSIEDIILQVKQLKDRGYQVQEAGACPVTLGPIEVDTLLVIWAQCTQQSTVQRVFCPLNIVHPLSP